MLYKLRADIVETDNGNHIAYGVDVYQLVRSVPCAFTDEQKALSFLKLCNEGQPCEDHLLDLIADRQSETAHP